MPRDARYQAAIMQDRKILLIQHREHESGRAYWLLPGGGMEEDETEEEAVKREVREETNLEVKVEALLLDEPAQPGKSGYKRYKTYLCSPVTLNAAPGYEPEPEVAAFYSIAQVGWFSIEDESTWTEVIINDLITAPLLRRIREALAGYSG